MICATIEATIETRQARIFSLTFGSEIGTRRGNGCRRERSYFCPSLTDGKSANFTRLPPRKFQRRGGD